MRANLTLLFALFACLLMTDRVAESVHAQGPFGASPQGRSHGEGQHGPPSRKDQMGDSDRLDLGQPLNRPQRPTPAQLIEKFDQDQDQKLSLEEAPEQMKKRFAKIDADKDGFVSAAELKTMLDRHGKKGDRGGAGKGKGDRSGKGGDKKGRRSPDPAKFIEKLDKDGDGKISLAEAPERMQNNFVKMDANEDGFIEASELKAVMEKMRGGKRGKNGDRKGGKKGKRDHGSEGDLKPVQPKAPPTDFPL